MKSIILLFISITALGLSSFGQTDSTDLSFEMGPAVYASEMDSVLFPSEYYSELKLEFDITDTSNFGKVHIELGSGCTIRNDQFY